MKRAILAMMILTATSYAGDISVSLLGNDQDDIVFGVGYATDQYTIGVGGGIWREGKVSPETDYTIGPFLTIPVEIPGNPFGVDLATFGGISPQIDLDSHEVFLELFAGAKLYADRQASPIIGCRYNWLPGNMKNDVTDGFELFGGLQIKF